MHDAQKVAVMAMLQSIESQVQTIRSLLGYDATKPAPAVTPMAQPNDTQYMTAKEEEKIDNAIEKDRLDMLSEAEMVQRRWVNQRKAMDEALEGAAI